ncbi:hypothetical protein CERSUDRAFT_117900 [Gelatoporia subvermispora B]|uniref:Zn(2)-C6 fungal-type domain-containing protein n=1 Tax=Ceriporiopsis subvermispora (strain B) TaxID=914234 RepID=M2R4K1_CERS8|nr:hypothetical protein CERSUDRAFT_117900 [Gelatoporia subvermispora B]
MVATAHGGLYAPYSRMPVFEEGFQSSEEGSDLHSPTFEAPYPQEVRYHLANIDFPPDVATNLLPTPFDARYTAPGLNTHVRDSHLLETIQMPSSATGHHLHQPQSTLGLHEQQMLELGGSSARLQSASLSPPASYAFNLPQNRLPGPQSRLAQDQHLSYSPRGAIGLSSTEQKAQPAQPSSSERDTSSPQNGSSTRPPRREASNVVIACRQCRARKIRCDSTRPVCANCVRRQNTCEYDAAPKRRGPDKRPGTRQRSCKKRPADSDTPAKKKRKTSSELDNASLTFDDMKVKENLSNGVRKTYVLSQGGVDDAAAMHMPRPPPLLIDTSISPRGIGPDAIYPKDELSPSYRRRSLIPNYPDIGYQNKTFARPIDVNIHRMHQEESEKVAIMPVSPSVEYSRRSWWEQLLCNYSATREQSLRDIIDDLTFLFTTSSYWLFFINVPVFIRDLQDPHQRAHMQPSLVMSALAMASLMRSSELELGNAGRRRAMEFRDAAQASLEEACNNQSVDYTLAEAALILALFESSCHPQYSPQRAAQALRYLDQIIQVLSLTFLDMNDPDASIFTPRAVPTVYLPAQHHSPAQCTCLAPPGSPTVNPDAMAFSFSFNPPWDPSWTDSEARREECRRLCWAALTLVASHTAQCTAFNEEPLNLALADPSNYALLFPGEAYERTIAQPGGQHPKDSVWALYCRSMLLWNSCSRQRDETWTTDERATFAVEAFQECRAIQDALDMHHCNLDTALMYVAREYLYNARMTITHELRRRLQDADAIIVPLFNRRQAEEWLYYQEQVAKRVKIAVMQLDQPAGQLLTHRPFQVTWFMSQVAICLSLWEYDQNLYNALELAKSFLIPLDTLVTLWPCPFQVARRNELRERLMEACTTARVHPPLAPELTLPPILRP